MSVPKPPVIRNGTEQAILLQQKANDLIKQFHSERGTSPENIRNSPGEMTKLLRAQLKMVVAGVTIDDRACELIIQSCLILVAFRQEIARVDAATAEAS